MLYKENGSIILVVILAPILGCHPRKLPHCLYMILQTGVKGCQTSTCQVDNIRAMLNTHAMTHCMCEFNGSL